MRCSGWSFPLFRVFVACLLLSVGGFGCQRHVSDKKIQVVTLAEAVELHERSKGAEPEALFIDARRASIYQEGTIEGAINLRPNDVDLRARPDPAREAKEALVVVGQDPSSGVARAMVKRLLQAA